MPRPDGDRVVGIVPVEGVGLPDGVGIGPGHEPSHHGAVVERDPARVKKTPEGEVRAVLGAGGTDRAGVATDALAPSPPGARVLGNRIPPVGDPRVLRPLLRERQVVGRRQRFHRVTAGARVVFGRPLLAGHPDPLFRLLEEGIEILVGDRPVAADAEEALHPEVLRRIPGSRAPPVHREAAHRHGSGLGVVAVVSGDVVAVVRVFPVVEEAAASVEPVLEIEDPVPGLDHRDAGRGVLGDALRHHGGADSTTDDDDIGFDELGHDQACVVARGAGMSAPEARSRQAAALMRTP